MKWKIELTQTEEKVLEEMDKAKGRELCAREMATLVNTTEGKARKTLTKLCEYGYVSKRELGKLEKREYRKGYTKYIWGRTEKVRE